MNATDLLNTLIGRQDLGADDTQNFFDAVVRGEIPATQIAGILVALRMKGESSEEIEGLVRAMRAHMVSVDAPGAIDIVGTGGDGAGTFNISTAAALIACGAGAKIAKHGNRAASSKCGSADVLEALGVRIELSAEQAARVFREAGIVFLFAPAFHPATKNVVAVRKELKTRTIFNVLGPFANPAHASRQLVGVPNPDIAKKMAQVGKRLDYERLLIVTCEGMDEIGLHEKTQALELRDGSVQAFTIDPAKLGFSPAKKSELSGGDVQTNATIIRDILGGKKGPQRDVAVLNAAYGLSVAGIASDAKEGVALAEESLDSGKAQAALERLIQHSTSV